MASTTELKDAVVKLVSELAAEAEPDAPSTPGYFEPWQLVPDLRKRGVLDHPDADNGRQALRDDARRSMDGKVRRALDAAIEEGTLVRHRVRGGDGLLPLLNGHATEPYGRSSKYTTPELYDRAKRAVRDRVARELAEREAFNELMERAIAADIPKPTSIRTGSVTFDFDGLLQIVECFEGSNAAIDAGVS